MEPAVFLTALAILGGTAVMVARTIAGAISSRRSSHSDLAQLKEQLEEHQAALEDAHVTLDNQAAQLAELQERLDFTERILSQGRERSALRPGEKE